MLVGAQALWREQAEADAGESGDGCGADEKQEQPDQRHLSERRRVSGDALPLCESSGKIRQYKTSKKVNVRR